MYAFRLAGWIAGCLALPVLLGAAAGPRWGGIGALIAVVATLYVVFWLPRSAHASFIAAKYPRAARRYWLVGALAFSRPRALSAQLSRAGCDVATGRFARAQALLGAFDGGALEPAERVVWLNNRACLLLDQHTGHEPDPRGALALVDQAIELRPDVPAVQHTRARALLAVGRIDDAIHVLDAMRSGGELAPQLESERCRELAQAWEAKGHAEYASEYRARAQLLATR